MPSIYAIIFGFRYLSISVLLKNEEKHVDILKRKIIRTEREREKMRILSNKKTSDFVNLPQNVPWKVLE